MLTPTIVSGYKQCLTCREVGTTPTMLNICGRQRHRASTPASSPEYFGRIITVPVLDHLQAELNTIFNSHQKTALQGLHLVPLLFVKESLATVPNKVLEVGQLYEVDLPSVSALKSELHSCVHQMKVHGEKGRAALPSSLATTLPKISNFYSNIKALIMVLCTLPVTSCSAERSFSGPKRIKSVFRSGITNERLLGLALLHMH